MLKRINFVCLVFLSLGFQPLNAQFSKPETGVSCSYFSPPDAYGLSVAPSGPEGLGTTEGRALALVACEEVASEAQGSGAYISNRGQCKFVNLAGTTVTPGGEGCRVNSVCLVDGEYEVVGPDDLCGALDEPKKDGGCKIGAANDSLVNNHVGNPCDVATGNKFQSETDFSYPGLSYRRYYNSQNLADIRHGNGWQNNHQKRLVINGDNLIQASANGKGEPWVKINDAWSADADSDVLLSENVTGFALTRANGTIEHFDIQGKLLNETDPQGKQQSYIYDANGLLEQVTSHYGLSMSFAYIDGRIASVTDPSGFMYLYEYDIKFNLVAVVYPDSTPDDNADNPRKIYHYENTQYPSLLTGITDANGGRYATWSYDANGKAISSEHAQTSNASGQERVELNFQGTN